MALRTGSVDAAGPTCRGQVDQRFLCGPFRTTLGAPDVAREHLRVRRELCRGGLTVSRYRGGQPANFTAHGAGLLVKPEVAAKQIDSETRAPSAPSPSSGVTGGKPDARPGAGELPPISPSVKQLRRFHGILPIPHNGFVSRFAKSSGVASDMLGWR